MKPTPRWVAELMRKVEVICGCWSELAIHAGYRTEKNEEQIAHGVPEGAPKEDYELSAFAVAIVASILPCFLIYDLFLQTTTQPGIPCSSVTLLAAGVS